MNGIPRGSGRATEGARTVVGTGWSGGGDSAGQRSEENGQIGNSV